MTMTSVSVSTSQPPTAAVAGDGDSSSGMQMTTPPPLEIDEHHGTVHGRACKWKALIFGQVMSFVLASTSAIQSELYLDCHLSAPTFSMLSVYLFICVGSLLVVVAQLFWKENIRLSPNRRSSSSLTEQDRALMHEANDQRNDMQPHDAPIVATQSSLSTPRARPEKRNNLLSSWSQRPPSENENDQSYASSIDGRGANEARSDASPRNSGQYSFFGLMPLQAPLRAYAIVAVVDVYANYTTIMAFKYTTITSVSLFDALAIPSAIIISRAFFGREYTKIHLLGVMVCSIGIVMNVLQDYREDMRLEQAGDDVNAQEKMIEEDYPYKMRGDFLAIMGGLLFGLDNTLQEVTVRESSLLEYLGCMTFFASIISSVQTLILERDQVMAFFNQSGETCPVGEGLALYISFAIGGTITYIGIGAFLQISDAAFLNLSLLTADAWTVAFSVFEEGIIPSASFYVALLITVSGVFIYETAPTPVVEDDVGEIQLPEIDHLDRGNDSGGTFT
ncbi:hypothetical protein ACHAWF_004564 [Thalassiosira exigua]